MTGFAGGGSSSTGITGTLTPGYIPVATGAHTLGDSVMSESGSLVTTAGSQAINGIANVVQLTIKANGTQTANLSEWQTSGGVVTFAVPAAPSGASGTRNTVAGSGAGVALTTGDDNVFLGYQAGAASTTNLQSVHIGSQAGKAVTTAAGIGLNVFIGYQAALVMVAGDGHTFIGGQAGQACTASSDDTFVGCVSGFSCTTGIANTYVGEQSGYFNQTGSFNVCLGKEAGRAHTGSFNVFVGSAAGLVATSGVNTFVGYSAGVGVTIGTRNVFMGRGAGNAATNDSDNVFIGADVCLSATTGINTSVVIGSQAGSNIGGGANYTIVGTNAGQHVNAAAATFIGFQAGQANTTGAANVMVGDFCGYVNTDGDQNTFVGSGCGGANTSGDNNTYIGRQAGITNVTGSNNVMLGQNADAGTTSVSSSIIIGAGTTGRSTSVIVGTAITSTTANDLIIQSNDTGLARSGAANFVSVTNGTATAYAIKIGASGRISGSAVAAPTFSSGSVTSNVATINTTAVHNLVTGQIVTISGSAGVAVNGTYIITVTSATAFTFSKTVGDGTITAATITPFASLQVGAAPVAPSATAEMQVGGSVYIEGNADETQLLVKGNATQSYTNPPVVVQNSSGTPFLQFGYNFNGVSNYGGILWLGNITPDAGNTNYTIASDGTNLVLNAHDGGALSLGIGGTSKWVVTASTGQLHASSTAGFSSTVDGVMSVFYTDETTPAWMQNGAGTKRLTANVTNATATFSNLTDLSMNVLAGRKYVGMMVVKCNNSTAAEGVKFDFNGGSATMTSFWAAASEQVGGTTVLGTAISTALNGVINYTTITGETIIVIYVSFVVNAAGTIIPRVAEDSTAIGTLTAELGSYWIMQDSSN